MKVEPLISDNYYHIYNRGNNENNIFISEENYYYFLKLLIKYILPISEIYSYCLMPNHFHLVLKLKEENDLPDDIKNGNKSISQPFSNLFNAYTKAFNKWHGKRGSLFQEHLKRTKIESSDYLKNLIIYVNTNSSHHAVEDYRNYKFSSYKALISQKKTSLDRDFVISLFDDVENFKYVLKVKKNNIESTKELTFE